MQMIDILERLKQIQESNPNINVTDAISNVQRTNGAVAEKVKNSPYAIGMAQAMKSTGDRPPLEKSTIKKAHGIAKSVMSKEDSVSETMTRQHFELFADTIKKIEDVTKRGQTAQMIADVMIKSNPRFDRDKFMQAAGVYTVTAGEITDAVAEDSQDELKKKLDDLKMKYNAQMANAYAGDPDDTEEEMAKIEKQLGITHEAKKMKKDKMNESIMIATDSPEEASMMMQLLKLAGVKPVDQNMLNQTAAEVPADAQADETYSNTPAPMVSDIKAAMPSGTDLSREKGTYPVASGGDNPMGKQMKESEITEQQLSNSLRAQYESFKQTYQEAQKAKPDYLDFDKDGNKAEPMTKALKDKVIAKK